jgi:hypothetical protein
MANKSGLEKALEYLINEDQEKAAEAFHNFIVGKARDIHESLIEEDELDEELVDEKADEEVDESDEEQVDEGFVDSEEYFGGSELATEDDDEMEPEEVDVQMDVEPEMGDGEADLGDEMGDEEAGKQELADALADLTAKFEEVMGIEVGDGDGDEDDMSMDMEPEMGDDMDMDVETAEESYFESKDEDADDEDDKEEVDEAVSHGAGVAERSNAKTDFEGKHGNRDGIKHNDDAKLPESADFDFDLTEEDFMDLEEGLKAIDVKMGGEQGGVKFAGEETNLKSPVANRDKSDIKADPKTMVAKQDEHGTYDRESAPSNDMLPHSEDNSHESMDSTGSPKRSQVSGAGGLEAQKGHKDAEQGNTKYAGTETNVKSPIGSAGTRNETGKSAKK